jgi:hypothetical protein
MGLPNKRKMTAHQLSSLPVQHELSRVDLRIDVHLEKVERFDDRR